MGVLVMSSILISSVAFHALIQVYANALIVILWTFM